MNIYHESMMVEDPQAVNYSSSGFLQSPPFREDRLSSVSSQYSLASQALTNSASLISSPKVPSTPDNAIQYGQMFNMTDRFGQAHPASNTEGLDLICNRHEDIHLDTHTNKCAATTYDMMGNFNMVGDDCWKLDATSEVPSFIETNSAFPNPEFAFDGIAMTANGSLPAGSSHFNFASPVLELTTQKDHLRTLSPCFNLLGRVTEDKSFDSINMDKKILRSQGPRSQGPRSQEENLEFSQETTASKFPPYNDVNELFRSCAANELSRMRVMKTESSTSASLSTLSSSSSSGTRTTRTRRRKQPASRIIKLQSEKADVEYDVGVKKKGKSFCPVCHNGYSRKEHMERHKRSHFGLDREKCYVETCDTKVKRKDNLIQHLSTHVRVTEKGSRSPDKMIPVEEMRSLIRRNAGKGAKRVIIRLEAMRMKMKVKDYLKVYGDAIATSGTKVSRSVRDHQIRAKL